MKCPKCGSENVNVQVTQDKIKTNHTGCLHGLGRLLLICCTLGLWLLVPERKENSKVTLKSMAVCQNCGNSWEVKK